MDPPFKSIESPTTLNALLKGKKEGKVIAVTILNNFKPNKIKKLKKLNGTPVKGVEIPNVPSEESFYFVSHEATGLLPSQWVPSSQTAWQLAHPKEEIRRLEHETLVVIYGVTSITQAGWKSIGLAGSVYYHDWHEGPVASHARPVEARKLLPKQGKFSPVSR